MKKKHSHSRSCSSCCVSCITHWSDSYCLCRRVHQPSYVLRAHPEEILARVVCGRGRLLLWWLEWRAALSISAAWPGPVLTHWRFRWGAQQPVTLQHHTLSGQRPNRTLALRLRHGCRVLRDRAGQVLTALSVTMPLLRHVRPPFDPSHWGASSTRLLNIQPAQNRRGKLDRCAIWSLTMRKLTNHLFTCK